MKNYRIFVEKRPRYRVEADSLRRELNENLALKIGELRLLNVYDLFGFEPELIEKSRYTVFGEVVTDTVTDTFEADGAWSRVAVEYLPGQFDQRAASAVDCVRLIDPTADVRIKSSRLMLMTPALSDEDLARVKHYCINAVEAREKDLSRLDEGERATVAPVPVLEGFRNMERKDLDGYCQSMGLAMNADDLNEVVEYFRREGRDPRETELRILDTYWSDHCRHTTFSTELVDVVVEDSVVKSTVDESLALWLKIRRELGREHKPLCLMDLATIGARYLRKKGLLGDLEVSEENNACSIFVEADVDGKPEKWLLQFKNETHNHPTEIEPFGGASTCLGGAIRDPLSGRSYVYQAMRVTGAADIYQPVACTMAGKLPQRVISRKAAAGYSSYGNQIGLATTHVREIYHPGFVAKRLEVGAVVGAVKAENVRRERPAAGDAVILLGGRTGRDGIGGATGSSKEHNEKSLETCGSEVQKGNAPEERKLERLFRRAEVTRMIKKSNDFGAGGVSVAIGELADGLDIHLDRVPVKYDGLNATELAISESQERMAVVVEARDVEAFMACCREENIESTHVADVTDTARMRMYYKGEKIVDLSREFIDSAGAKHFAKVRVAAVEDRDPWHREVEGAAAAERLENNMKDDNVLSQKGLVEMFDATIGASTVLMPYGGRTQQSETQVSVQKLPTEGYTETASMMAFGYDPEVSSWSPCHGAAAAVVDACAKVVAAGGQFEHMRFSYQEYFERMKSEKSWGKPLSALLGALQMQVQLGLPSIGGKDSMSGTFRDIDVPPTLIAFGITTVDARRVVSTDLKGAGHCLSLVRHTPLANRMPDTEQLRRNFALVERLTAEGKVLSGWAVGVGGVAEAVVKMAFGNRVGVEITMAADKLFDRLYGSILIETAEPVEGENVEPVGRTVADEAIRIEGCEVSLDRLWRANSERFATIYPDRSTGDNPEPPQQQKVEAPVVEYKGEAVEHPIAYLPVFPGTNCDYDTARAFRRAGARTTTSVFCNLESEDIFRSIEQMRSHIAECHILVLSGGFSAGDEPDGSGKFIANVLNNKVIAEEIHRLLDRGGLILGICNGFQALVKSGLLPYGRLGCVGEDSPTLFRNDINRHISQIVSTRVASNASPWLRGFEIGELHSIAVSHGEGKFMVNAEMAAKLFANGQVAFQYADAEGRPTTQSPWNPNGSWYAIEGITACEGRILGKMGHTERYDQNLFKNIAGQKRQPLFDNAVAYFRKTKQ